MTLGSVFLISCPLWTDTHCARQIEKVSYDLQFAGAAAFVFICHILGRDYYYMFITLSLIVNYFLLLSKPVNEQIIVFLI